jgi:hypothetical protein
MITPKQRLWYNLRWQLSTLVLAPVMAWLAGWNPWIVAAIANLIGANIFIYVDEIIFNKKWSKQRFLSLLNSVISRKKKLQERKMEIIRPSLTPYPISEDMGKTSCCHESGRSFNAWRI